MGVPILAGSFVHATTNSMDRAEHFAESGGNTEKYATECTPWRQVLPVSVYPVTDKITDRRGDHQRQTDDTEFASFPENLNVLFHKPAPQTRLSGTS